MNDPVMKEVQNKCRHVFVMLIDFIKFLIDIC